MEDLDKKSPEGGKVEDGLGLDDETFIGEETPGEETPGEETPGEDGREKKTEEAAASSNEGQQEDDAPPEEPKVLPGVQKRINQLTAEKNQARREAEALRAKLEETLITPSVPETPPKLEDFDFDDEKYLQAVIDYKVKKETQTLKEELARDKQERERAELNIEFARKVKESKIENYAETAKTLLQTVPFPAELIDIIQVEENGPQLVDYLGKHLDVADRIVSLPPTRAAAEIGKLSVQLKTLTKKKTSKAPDPPKRLGGGGSPIKKKWEDMSMDEIYADDSI